MGNSTGNVDWMNRRNPAFMRVSGEDGNDALAIYNPK